MAFVLSTQVGGVVIVARGEKLSGSGLTAIGTSEGRAATTRADGDAIVDGRTAKGAHSDALHVALFEGYSRHARWRIFSS